VRSLNQAALRELAGHPREQPHGPDQPDLGSGRRLADPGRRRGPAGLAQDTLATREESLKLIQSRVEAGAASTSSTCARPRPWPNRPGPTSPTYIAQVEQDKNALRLVVGADIPADLTAGRRPGHRPDPADLPAGVVSDVLTRRPDVLAAEHQLAGANANIGAARAAFFPRIA
jgi:multidrug efflux system outer membrane protein